MKGEYADVPFIGPPHSYGTTQYAKRYGVLHCTASLASARQEADYGLRRTDGVSTHYVSDHVETIQCLRTEYGANHVGSQTGNRYGIAYEIRGLVGWDRKTWLNSVAWPVLVRQIARDCRRWDIPPVLLSIEQMRDGKSKGLVTHDMARRAWGGTTHTDPGAGFPLDYVLAAVRAELDGETMNDAQWKKFEEMYAELVRGKLTDDNAQYYWLRGLALGVVPTVDEETGAFDWSRPVPAPWKGLVQIGEEMAAITEKLGQVGAVTDEQLERVLRKILRSVPE